MWGLRPVLFAAAGLLAISACTGSSGDGQAPSPGETTVADPGPTLSEQDLSQIPMDGPAPTTVLDGDLSAPWSVAAAGQTGKTIKIVYDHGNCLQPLGAEVQESPESVEITVVLKREELNCASVDLPAVNTVRLKTPLGTRTLLHAPTSPEFGVKQIYGG